MYEGEGGEGRGKGGGMRTDVYACVRGEVCVCVVCVCVCVSVAALFPGLFYSSQ